MKPFAACLIVPALALSAGPAGGAIFRALGDLPGGYPGSYAEGVSDDGSVVVGWSNSASGREAFRWTAATGMVGLGDLAGGNFDSEAKDVSADGSVVVGYGRSAAVQEAFRWTAATGMAPLGDLPGGDFGSDAKGVSADGSVVVGISGSSGGWEAFRWTAAAGMAALGDLPGGDFRSDAKGVSADGSVVVGGSYSPGGYEAYRWTDASGMVGLGDLPGGPFGSDAMGVSADGSVVVGFGTSAPGREAFRWTAATGMVGLGDLPGGNFESLAYDASADGSVVVGYSSATFREWSATATAFIWDQTSGMRNLKDFLTTGYGLDLTGWWLNSASAISPNGLGIVGYGLNPSGSGEAWLVLLDPLELNWVSPSGGGWDAPENWDFFHPATHMTDVFIRPATGLTVYGPGATTTIKSLTLGAGSGTTTLQLQLSRTLTVNELTTITAHGKLAGSGTFNAVGGIDNSGQIDLGSGSLQLVGGTLANHGVIRGSGQIENTLDNRPTGEIRVGPAEEMVFSGSGSTNAGRIEVIGGEIEFTQGLINAAATGLITGRDATLRFGAGLSNAGSVAISFGTSDIFGDLTNTGTIVLTGDSHTTFYDDLTNDGTLQISKGSSAVFFGAFAGLNGTTGTGRVFIEGDLRPGHSIGAVSFGGDLILGPAARLEIQLGATQRGSRYDTVDVGGLASLGGTLEIALIDGFTPNLGDSFQILSYGSVEGDFAQYKGLDLGNGLRLEFNFTESGCVSNVVPEPSALVLAALAAGLLAIAARRRQGGLP